MNYVTFSTTLINDVVTNLEHPMFSKHQDFLAHMVENDVTRFTCEIKQKYDFEYILEKCLEKGHFPLFKDIVKHSTINEAFLLKIVESQRSDMLEYLISLHDIENYFPMLMNYCLEKNNFQMMAPLLHHGIGTGVEMMLHQYLQKNCSLGNKDIIKHFLDCSELKKHIHWHKRYDFNENYQTCLGASVYHGYLSLAKLLIKPIRDINLYQPEFMMAFMHLRENSKKTLEMINLFLFDKELKVTSEIEAQVLDKYGHEAQGLLTQYTDKRNKFLKIEGKFNDKNYILQY